MHFHKIDKTAEFQKDKKQAKKKKNRKWRDKLQFSERPASKLTHPCHHVL